MNRLQSATCLQTRNELLWGCAPQTHDNPQCKGTTRAENNQDMRQQTTFLSTLGFQTTMKFNAYLTIVIHIGSTILSENFRARNPGVHVFREQLLLSFRLLRRACPRSPHLCGVQILHQVQQKLPRLTASAGWRFGFWCGRKMRPDMLPEHRLLIASLALLVQKAGNEGITLKNTIPCSFVKRTKAWVHATTFPQHTQVSFARLPICPNMRGEAPKGIDSMATLSVNPPGSNLVPCRNFPLCLASRIPQEGTWTPEPMACLLSAVDGLNTLYNREHTRGCLSGI